jgi:hypothetical protein
LSADCSPEHARRACADSLKRLKLECIELYQLYAVDHRVPIEDSVAALVDLQRREIRHIGVSNVSETELARARARSPRSSPSRTATISPRKVVRRSDRYLRRRWHCLYPVVSAGRGPAGQPGFSARRLPSAIMPLTMSAIVAQRPIDRQDHRPPHSARTVLSYLHVTLPFR